MKIIEKSNPDHIKTAIRRVADHVTATLRYMNGLSEVPPSPCNLSGLQLAGIDLTGAKLTDATLAGADLSGADLAGVMLDCTDLTGTKLNGADLLGGNLIFADLTGAKLVGTDLTDATLDGAILEGADLAGAKLARVNLIGTNLKGAKLDDADLAHAKLMLSPEILTANFNGVKNLDTAEFSLKDGRRVIGIAIDPQTGRLVPESENPGKDNPKNQFQATAENTVRFADIYPDLLARARRAGYLPKEAAPASPPAP